jgi:MFS family permease
MSSEMIYPLLPIFISKVLLGGALAIGIVEGAAETTSAVFKVFSGVWTDRIRKRKVFIVYGYGIAGFVRPLIGLATSWVTVLVLRVVDRLGKGIRTSPRDALIADVTPSDRLGAAFGLHRSMDHAGAVIGPLIAAALLNFGNYSLRTIFLLAVIPSIAAFLVALFAIKEKQGVVKKHPDVIPLNPIRGFSYLGRDFHIFLASLLLFALGNSTDAFILARLYQGGVSPAFIAMLWSFHHIIKMTSTYGGGLLADKIGRKSTILIGWFVYALVYLAFAFVQSETWLIAIFMCYGMYYGLSEPPEKALIADLAGPDRRGTAFGFYHFTLGLAAFPASVLFGAVWQIWGMEIAFQMGALLAICAAIILLFVRAPKRQEKVI